MNIYIYSSEIRPSVNTLAHYPLKTNGNDDSGKGKNMTDVGFTFSNNVAVFNGSQYGNVPSVEGYRMVQFRAKAENKTPTGLVISGNTTTPAAYIFQIFTDNVYCGGSGGGDFNNSYSYGSSGNISWSTWHLFTMTQTNYNYTQGDSFKLYKDGVLFATQANHTFNFPITRIGEYAGSGYTFKGNLSDLRIEDREWTQAMIQFYYNNTKSLYGIN